MKMKKVFDKRIILIILFVIALMFFIVFKATSRGIQQEVFSTINYSVKYDTTWKIKSSNDNEIVFIHNDTKSTIDISISELDKNLYGKSLKQIASNVKSKIEHEYPQYKCISESTTYLNENISEAYQLLFEDGKRQSLVQIGMHGYTVFVSNYTGENRSFDILLDSVQTINSNFKVKDKTVEMMNLREIETTGYTVKSDNVDYGQVEDHLYIGAYYKVRYTMPVQFKSRALASSYYRMDESKNMKEHVYISSSNENIFNVFDSTMKEVKELQYEKIETEKIKNGELVGYAIKGTTKYNKEKYYLLYVLNNFNTLVITIEGENVTQGMLENIRIIEYSPCGNYIDRTTVDGYYVGTLTEDVTNIDNQTFKYNVTTISVDYKVPEKYEEIVEPTHDLGAPESARAFVIGKVRNSEITKSEWETDTFYDYNISMDIAYGNAESIANREGLKYKKDVKIGNITYKYYTSQYDSQGTTIKEAYYIADIGEKANNKYSYRIYVASLDDVPESVLQDFASVNIDVKVLE